VSAFSDPSIVILVLILHAKQFAVFFTVCCIEENCYNAIGITWIRPIVVFILLHHF